MSDDAPSVWLKLGLTVAVLLPTVYLIWRAVR